MGEYAAVLYTPAALGEIQHSLRASLFHRNLVLEEMEEWVIPKRSDG
jgi:hypothetical protein